MVDIVTGLAVLVVILAAGVLLMTVLSGINDVGGKDEHEDGGF